MSQPYDPQSPPHDPRSRPLDPQPDRDDDTRELVRQQGHEVAATAREQAGHVAHTASEEASQVTHEAARHVRELAGDAKHQLHRQASEQTQHLGGALEQLGSRVHALADGDVEEAGPIGDYAHRLAQQVDQLADRVGDGGFDGLLDDVQRFARQRPAAFLAGAAVAGFAVSRLGRGVQAAGTADAGQARSQASSTDGLESSTSVRPTPAAPPPPSAPTAMPTGGGATSPDPLGSRQVEP